jgi:hypothetical protein
MTIENYIEAVENPILKRWATVLHEKILMLMPQVQPSIKFKVPFYDYHRWLCYFTVYEKHIELSFLYGYLLSNKQGFLSAAPAKGKRKDDLAQVRKIFITEESILQSEGLLEVIAEAALLNEMAAKEKIKNYARASHEKRSIKK